MLFTCKYIAAIIVRTSVDPATETTPRFCCNSLNEANSLSVYISFKLPPTGQVAVGHFNTVITPSRPEYWDDNIKHFVHRASLTQPDPICIHRLPQ